MRKVLYISGPFGLIPEGYDELHGIRYNINEASRYALMAARNGWAPFCPHKNTSDFQHIEDINNESWMEICLTFVQKSDALLMIPGWERSKGAERERDLAIMLGIPVHNSRDGIPMPTKNVRMDDEIKELEKETI
jgi:nucleoside 2-deoxyribosyltransferase